MNELKPCPFCGGSAEYDGRHTTVKYIECNACNVEMFVNVHENSTETLIDRWNKRVGSMVEVEHGPYDEIYEEGVK